MNGFISTGNWRHQCLKQVKRFLDETALLPGVGEVIEDALSDLQDSVRFVLPLGMGQWYDVTPEIDLAVDRLPFDKVVFEYGPKENAGCTQVMINGQVINRDHACSRRLICAEQIEDSIAAKFFFFDDSKKTWTLYPFGAWLEKRGNNFQATLDSVSGGGFKDGPKNLWVRPFPLGHFGRVMLAHGITFEQAWLDVQEEMHVLSVVLELLGCKNVRAEKVSNEAEKSKKNLPPALKDDYYKICVITRAKSYDDGDNDGSSSPRSRPSEHLRRGHTYHPRPGVKMWRQGCIVNPGIGPRVEKDYSVRM